MATSIGIISKLHGLLSPVVSAGSGKVGNGGGQAQTGFAFYTLTGVNLGNTSVPFSQTNIKPPNGYALSNLQIYLSVTDTTGGTTAPASPASIESVIQQLQIVGASGRPIAVFDGVFGELQRWQSLLNDQGIYSSAPTPADTAVSTQYNAIWNFAMKHLVIDPSELTSFAVSGLINVLASRATALNGMTSQVVQLTLSADFVPTSGYVKTLYHTKQFGTALTSGYAEMGNQLDDAVLSSIAADFGADAKLSASNTFYLAQAGNSLIPYTSYNAIVAAQSNTSALSAPHITGMFPMQALYKAAVDGTKNVSWRANLAAAPTGGGVSGNINIYEAEQYQ